MIYLILQGLLILNVFIQFIIKGHNHVKLLKMMGYDMVDASLYTKFFMGPFSKYPTVMMPFIERIDCDTEETQKQYHKVKKHTRILLFSIALPIIYFALLMYFLG